MKIESATQTIKDKLIGYLDQAFPVKKAKPSIKDVFEKFQNEGLDFIKEPYLELATVYEEAVETLADLARSGELEPEVAAAFAKYLLENDNASPEKIKLYVHQLNSLRAVGRDKKNLVVCTGTGSGKTECFLLPVVNEIFKQHKAAETEGRPYHAHVRALILYPMNALVNDQIRRLRKLLKHLPGITFGRYINIKETKNDLEEIDYPDGFLDIWKAAGKQAFVQNGNGDGRKRDENFLPEEYRYRSRWRKEGGADILVTNYAMLERLLLLPKPTKPGQKDLFDPNHPWDFIVLDEAHSYTGSAGTEIAWLIRRLENRLRKTGHDIRFIATSATLSTGGNKEENERKTREFAASLFPAPADEAHLSVQSGEPETNEFSMGETGDADSEFFKRTDIEQLVRESFEFEAKKAEHKGNERQNALIAGILEMGGCASLSDVVMLDPFLKCQPASADGINASGKETLVPVFMHHPAVLDDGGAPVEGNEVLVTDGIRWLCKLMLTYSKSFDDYRTILHDEAHGGGSEWNGDGNPFGNRLSLFKVWSSLADGQTGLQSIHLETLSYLYQAIETLLQPETRAETGDAVGIQNLKIEFCRSAIDALGKTIEQHAEDESELTGQEATLFSKWKTILPGVSGSNYHELVFNAIQNRNDVRRFFESANKNLPLSKTAKDAGLDVATMSRLMDVGSLAIPHDKRRPLVDVRFHQVLRDISNVGVYFENGDATKPVFVHSEDEFSETGEKIFGLGVCRRCGQPYLLGYASKNPTGKNDFSAGVFRFPAKSHSHLFAFTLTGAETEGTGDEEDPVPGNWKIDLKDGTLALTSSERNIHWLRGHSEMGDEFLSPCPACGGKATNYRAFHGIVTPYEAMGIQFKIKALQAFAGVSNEDPVPRVRESSPAGGRKVLSFSDSRRGAAELAYQFEQLVQTEYCDELVKLLSKDFNCHKQPSSAAVETARANFALMGVPWDEMTFRRNYMANNSRVSNVSELINYPDGTNRLAKLVEADHYERLLEIEKDDGTLEDSTIVSKFRLLKALLAGNRRVGLIPSGVVRIRSKTIDGMTNDSMDFRLLFGEPAESPTVDQKKGLLQKVFAYLVQTKRLYFAKTAGETENDALKTAFYRYEPKDDFTARTFTNRAVIKIVKNALDEMGCGNIPNLDNLGNNIRSLFVNEKIVAPKGDNGYVFLFDKLCDDLIVDLVAGETTGLEGDKVLPLVVQEHTAQIDSDVGSSFQREFSAGRINVLSCSTTFEMGIDVGSLNNVFLGNMPPLASNYRQRAGRAGRRPGSAPYILTLCGSQSSYDRDYYENPEKLFFGSIEPPRLYLDQPQFAARHFRAEALHGFLEFIEGKRNSPDSGDRDVSRNWRKVSWFLLGRQSVKNQETKEYNSQAIHKTCCDWLPEWKASDENDVMAGISAISGYEELFLRHLAGNPYGKDNGAYSAVDDVIFQLVGDGDFGGKNGREGYDYFRDLGGCHVPALDDSGELVEKQDRPRRLSLKRRLEWKFVLLADDGDDVREIGNDWEARFAGWSDNANLSLSQCKVLWQQTIDALSDACVLPRYGFPVDSVELKPHPDDVKARGIKLQRPMQLGIFEYAPGQSVYANKRRFESRAAKFFRWNNGDVAQTVAATGSSLKFCHNCKKVFFYNEEKCPCCGEDLDRKNFVMPEVFLAKRSSINPPRSFPSRNRLVSWGGEVRKVSKCGVKGMSLSTAEPSERAVHYINPGDGFEGFDGNYYICEMPTNVALWFPGFWTEDVGKEFQLPALGKDENRRISDAWLSAMYALRRSISKTLRINERDVGCILQPYNQGGKESFWFVFFDTDNGGGSGCVLDLLPKDENDADGMTRIRTIVEGAVETLTGCTCGDGRDQHLTPTDAVTARRDGKGTTWRERASCYKCLRSYDNQFDHDSLDRKDALVVLKMLLDGTKHPANAVVDTLPDPARESEADHSRQWSWAPFSGKLRVNQWYKTSDGTEFQYKSGLQVDRNAIEQEKGE